MIKNSSRRLYELRILQNMAQQKGTRTIVWGMGGDQEAQRLVAGSAAGSAKAEQDEE